MFEHLPQRILSTLCRELANQANSSCIGDVHLSRRLRPRERLAKSSTGAAILRALVYVLTGKMQHESFFEPLRNALGAHAVNGDVR